MVDGTVGSTAWWGVNVARGAGAALPAATVGTTAAPRSAAGGLASGPGPAGPRRPRWRTAITAGSASNPTPTAIITGPTGKFAGRAVGGAGSAVGGVAGGGGTGSFIVGPVISILETGSRAARARAPTTNVAASGTRASRGFERHRRRNTAASSP